MNFYLGNSINEIEISDNNVYFSDELIEYLYLFSKKNKCDMEKLLSIDCYCDEVICKEDTYEIYNICQLILSSDILKGFNDQEGNIMVKELAMISKEAIRQNKGLVSIGD